MQSDGGLGKPTVRRLHLSHVGPGDACVARRLGKMRVKWQPARGQCQPCSGPTCAEQDVNQVECEWWSCTGPRSYGSCVCVCVCVCVSVCACVCMCAVGTCTNSRHRGCTEYPTRPRRFHPPSSLRWLGPSSEPERSLNKSRGLQAESLLL
jgi:hypothetical protein